MYALVAPLEVLAPGAYRVRWRVVSADGHAVEGTLAFRVAGAVVPAPDVGATGIVRPAGPPVLATALTALPVALAPARAAAHAVVYPKTSAPGAYERYLRRVPNENAVPTERVEIRFPEGLRVTAFADVPGWRLEVLADSTRRITGAVWTGTLAPQRFVELSFVAANPKTPGRLAWSTYQTYAGGERVEWTGGEGTKTPASATTVAAPAIAAAPAPTDGGVTRWVPWVALGVALVSLGLGLRRPEPAR